jgi:hypothetical protein
MEITPTGQPYQNDDEMYEDPGEGEEGGGGAVAPHDHLDVEGTTNGVPGDGSETPKGKRIPPPMSSEKAAYLAGGGYIAGSHQSIFDARGCPTARISFERKVPYKQCNGHSTPGYQKYMRKAMTDFVMSNPYCHVMANMLTNCPNGAAPLYALPTRVFGVNLKDGVCVA